MGLQQLEQSDSGNYDQESDNHEVMPQYSQKDSLNTEHGDFGDCFMLTDDILSDFACQLELQNPGSFATSTFEQLNAGYFNSSAGEKTGFELSGDYILSSLIQPAFDFLGSADLGPPAPQGKKSDRTSLAESRPHDKEHKPFQCHHQGCIRPGPFKAKGSLTRHLNTQHLAPQSFMCEVCFRTFNRKDNMYDHCRRIHGYVA